MGFSFSCGGPQCTDIQVQAKNGTGPYTLTVRTYSIDSTLDRAIQNAQVAPTLHPPLNITSNGGPINWTVSLVRDSRIFGQNLSHLMMISPMGFRSSSHSPTREATRGRRGRCIVAPTIIPRALT